MHGFYNKIKSALQLDSSAPINVCISGGFWDLACNAIHFIDLVSWWSQASVTSVNSDDLGEWVQSKRPGFNEVFGDLVVIYSNGSKLELSCSPQNEKFKISVFTAQGIWTINEIDGFAVGPNGQILRGGLTYQSELTAPLVNNIFQNGNCDLPPLVDSIKQHRPFIKALLKHWNLKHDSQSDSLPIT